MEGHVVDMGERTRIAAIREARRHPRRWAQKLGEIERQRDEAKAKGNDAEADRLSAMVDGIREGLKGSDACGICGRKLENPESIARGIGTECWAQGKRVAS
jgi:DNA repair exonuclease SbcCD ATPase subunit